MERTRSNLLTFFTAFSNPEEVFTGKRNLDSLKKEDYIKAAVTDEEKAELKASDSRVNNIIKTIYNILKRKNKKKEDFVDELEEKFGPAEPGNPIYDQGQKMNDMEKEEKERTRDK